MRTDPERERLDWIAYANDAELFTDDELEAPSVEGCDVCDDPACYRNQPQPEDPTR